MSWGSDGSHPELAEIACLNHIIAAWLVEVNVEMFREQLACTFFRTMSVVEYIVLSATRPVARIEASYALERR